MRALHSDRKRGIAGRPGGRKKNIPQEEGAAAFEPEISLRSRGLSHGLPSVAAYTPLFSRSMEWAALDPEEEVLLRVGASIGRRKSAVRYFPTRKSVAAYCGAGFS